MDQISSLGRSLMDPINLERNHHKKGLLMVGSIDLLGAIFSILGFGQSPPSSDTRGHAMSSEGRLGYLEEFVTLLI